MGHVDYTEIRLCKFRSVYLLATALPISLCCNRVSVIFFEIQPEITFPINQGISLFNNKSN